jgi:hypothetical protein
MNEEKIVSLLSSCHQVSMPVKDELYFRETDSYIIGFRVHLTEVGRYHPGDYYEPPTYPRTVVDEVDFSQAYFQCIDGQTDELIEVPIKDMPQVRHIAERWIEELYLGKLGLWRNAGLFTEG